MTPEQELIKKQQEYIQLLSDELDEVVEFVYLRGWRSQRIEAGIKIREEIEKLQNQITSL